MKLQFNIKYFLLTILLFLTEVLIATAGKNLFILRAYIGDVLVVMLIYTFILSFVKVQNKEKLLIYIFLFSVIVETAQYFKVADLLGFKAGSIPHIVIGNSFSWIDILCYGLGCIVIKIINYFRT